MRTYRQVGLQPLPCQSAHCLLPALMLATNDALPLLRCLFDAGCMQEQGAELLVAITHMRVPNDRRFAAECPEYHIVMGGHDHHYETDFVGPVLMVKSGTDFR